MKRDRPGDTFLRFRCSPTGNYPKGSAFFSLAVPYGTCCCWWW